MKILYISQYYPPEMCAPAVRVAELSRAWAKRGHDVTVLTAFPHHPHGTKRKEDERVLTRREKDGAIDVVRTYVFAARNAGFLPRVLSYVSFMLSAILIGTFRVGRPDVVIATSPQLFTAIAGWWFSLWSGAPFVFEVRDLWPESITTVGAMRESLAIRMLRGMAHWLYRTADQIVTVGDGYRRRILASYSGIAPDKIAVVTNGVDLDRFTFRDVDRKRVRSEQGWQNQTVVLYLGTHGMAHGLDFVLRAADTLRGSTDLRFVFMGDGAEKQNLIKLADELQLQNVTFLKPQPANGVAAYYAAADICLVPLRKVDLFDDVLPSKLFEIMSMQRPAILSVDGDARRLLEAADAGIFVEPENVERLCAAIETLRSDPEQRSALGANGRRYVELHFDRSVLARRYLNLLDRVVRERLPQGIVVGSGR